MGSWSIHNTAKRLLNNMMNSSLIKNTSLTSTMHRLYLQIRTSVSSCRQDSQHFNSLCCLRIRSESVVFDKIRIGSRIQANNLKKLCLEAKNLGGGIMKVDSRVTTPKTWFQYHEYGSKHFQGFSTSSCTASQLNKRMGFAGPEKVGDVHTASVEDGWALRLANENVFLSWCRNCYLTTVVAIAMMGEGTTALAEQAAEGAFVVAGLNLSWGTYQYIYSLFHLRKKSGMSGVGFLLYVSMAALHLALWLVVCTLYLGYTDPDIGAEVKKEQTLKEEGV